MHADADRNYDNFSCDLILPFRFKQGASPPVTLILREGKTSLLRGDEGQPRGQLPLLSMCYLLVMGFEMANRYNDKRNSDFHSGFHR